MDKLQRAAAAQRAARSKLEEAIREAAAEGRSLRDIAKAVGWSHEQVRRTIRG